MTVTLANTPVLQTERLTLRAPQAGDWPAWHAYAMSDRSRFTGGPLDEKTAWRAFGHVIGHWILRGFGSFTLCAKGSEDALGLVGPWYPATWPEREIGWTMLDRSAEGRGYAFEAALAARDHAFRDLGWDTAVSYIDVGNARSIALAERLGAVRDDAAPRPAWGDPCLVYRHPAPQVAA